MDYDVDYRDEHAISMKALIILFSGGAVAAFVVLALFVFPISNLIREEITEVATVIIKEEGTCIVEASDMRPRTIQDCNLTVGESVIISYKEGTLPIIRYSRT